VRRVVIAPTFEAWRQAARRLLAEEAHPRTLAWEPEDAAPALDGLLALDLPPSAGDGLTPPSDASPDATATTVARAPDAPETDAIAANDAHAANDGNGVGRVQPRVPRAFLETAEAAACHADGERWALLYRVLWRLTHGEPKLMEVAVDGDVHRLLRMAKAVGREVHKMHAFVRFREVAGDECQPHYVAWFEPAHPVVERGAPFFARRFPSMRWSILTPHRCAHWDGEALRFTAGVPRSAAPTGDALEALWRTYYASIFNPARLRPGAMRAEMPKRYWRNLPEAALIPDLAADAPARVRRMIEEQHLPRPPRPRRRRDEAPEG
jgi:probable DNA metabolism protein